MSVSQQRVTVVLTARSAQPVYWTFARITHERIVFLPSAAAVQSALERAMCDDAVLDIERVVIDRALSAQGFLEFLAGVPEQFLGDVILVNEDDAGFLSTTTRGGGRALYRLSEKDIRFYLETAMIAAGREPVTAAALQDGA